MFFINIKEIKPTVFFVNHKKNILMNWYDSFQSIWCLICGLFRQAITNQKLVSVSNLPKKSSIFWSWKESIISLCLIWEAHSLQFWAILFWFSLISFYLMKWLSIVFKIWVASLKGILNSEKGNFFLICSIFSSKYIFVLFNFKTLTKIPTYKKNHSKVVWKYYLWANNHFPQHLNIQIYPLLNFS